MPGKYQYDIELKSNVAKLLTDMKEVQDRLDTVEGKEYKIKLNIDEKKLSNVISNLEKMLDSLGKGTGDFKQFENLSKELSSIVSEVQNLSKAFGKVDDSGAKTLLSSIQNIDKSLSELSQHIINVNKNMSNIGGDTNGTVKQVENISNAYDNASKSAEKLADAQSKIGNKSNISSENSIVENQNQLKENKKLTDENISSLYEFIKLCQEQARVLGETNEELKERAAYFKDENISGKVSVGTHYAGNHDASILDGANSDIHSHFSKYASFSESDLFNLKEQLKNFMVMGTDELTHLDLSGINEEILRSITLRYDTAVKELNQQFLNNLSIKDNLKFTDIEDIPESIFEKAFEYAEQSSNIDYDYDKYDEFFESEIKRIREKLLQGASLNDIVNVASEDVSKFEVDGVSDDIKQFREKFVDGIRGYLSNILQENDVFNPDKLLNLKEYNDGRNNALRSVLDDLGVGADRLKTIDISNLEEGYTSVLNVLGLVNDKQEEVIQTAKQVEINPPIKDVFQGDDKVNTDASTTAIKEESQALEQVSTSAKDAANSKEKFAKANKEVKESADNSKTSISEEEKYFNSLGKSLTQYQNTLTSISRKPADGNRSKELQEKIDIIFSSIEKLNALKSKTEENGYIFNKNDVDTGKQLEETIKKNIELVKQMSAAQKGSDALSRGKEIDTITKYLNKFTGISKKAKHELNGLLDQLQSGDPSVNVKKIHERFLELTVAERNAGREARNLFDIFKDKKIYSFLGQAASMFSFYDLINLGREGFNVIKDLDSALTEIRKVSDETTSSLKEFQSTSFDVAKQVGTTALEIQNSAADFMRLGYSLKEASKLSEDANIYANVGDMDISEATEHMISSIQAWQSEFSSATEASTNIIDRYNEIGNRFAITSADIGSAMERSAAALKAGGNDLNESIGLITAGNLIQQDADTTANALKVMSLRIRGSKADLESMGESTDDLADSTSKLREQIKALTGIDIMLDENTFKSTAEIIKEIGAEWEKLTDVSKASTLEILAGKTRASTVAGLIENYQTIEEVIKAAEESENSARIENEKYIQSIEGRLNLLQSQAQEFWYKVIDSDTIKNGITLLTNLLELGTNIVDTFGVLPTILAGAGITAFVKKFA